MYGDSVILRAARRPSSGPSAGTGAAIAGSLESSSTIEIDVRRRAAVAFPLDADLIRLRPDPARHDDPRTELVVGVGRSPDEVRDDRDGVVVVGSGSLGDRLDRVARWSDDGLVIGFEVDPSDGPPSAVVTVAILAGARVLVLPEGAEESGLAREVRRTADLTEALLIERGAPPARYGAVST